MYSSTPLSAVVLSKVSVTHNQPPSEAITSLPLGFGALMKWNMSDLSTGTVIQRQLTREPSQLLSDHWAGSGDSVDPLDTGRSHVLGGTEWDFITLRRTVSTLQLMNCLLLEFSIYVTMPCLSPHFILSHRHFIVSHHHKMQGEYSTVRYSERERDHIHILWLRYIVVIVLFYY